MTCNSLSCRFQLRLWLKMTDLISKIAKIGSCLFNRDAIRDCNVACEVAKEVCNQSVSRLVVLSCHGPCLQSCSADSTPIHVSIEAQRRLPNNSLIRRARVAYGVAVCSLCRRCREDPHNFLRSRPYPVVARQVGVFHCRSLPGHVVQIAAARTP